MMVQPIRWLAPALLLLGFVYMAPAHALSCSATISNVSLGNVDVLSASDPLTTATGTVGITCNTAILEAGGTVTGCISLNNGTGGWDASSRLLAGSGSNTLRYQLYRDAAYTQVWGWAGAIYPTPQRFVFNVSDGLLGIGGTGSASGTLYAAVPGSQSSVPVGSYSSTFVGGSTAKLTWARGDVACSSATNTVSTSNFTVSASVVSNCSVAAQDLDFGSVPTLLSSVDGSGTINVTCTSGATYSVGLSNGNNFSLTRRMREGVSTKYVSYELYRDATRLLRWGSGLGNEVTGTGAGSSQPLTVYGRVPLQPTAEVGSYTDTIVATVTF